MEEGTSMDWKEKELTGKPGRILSEFLNGALDTGRKRSVAQSGGEKLQRSAISP